MPEDCLAQNPLLKQTSLPATHHPSPAPPCHSPSSNRESMHSMHTELRVLARRFLSVFLSVSHRPVLGAPLVLHAPLQKVDQRLQHDREVERGQRLARHPAVTAAAVAAAETDKETVSGNGISDKAAPTAGDERASEAAGTLGGQGSLPPPNHQTHTPFATKDQKRKICSETGENAHHASVSTHAAKDAGSYCMILSSPHSATHTPWLWRYAAAPCHVIARHSMRPPSQHAVTACSHSTQYTAATNLSISLKP